MKRHLGASFLHVPSDAAPMNAWIVSGFAFLLFSLIMTIAATVDGNFEAMFTVFVGALGLLAVLVGATRLRAPAGALPAARAPPDRLS